MKAKLVVKILGESITIDAIKLIPDGPVGTIDPTQLPQLLAQYRELKGHLRDAERNLAVELAKVFGVK